MSVMHTSLSCAADQIIIIPVHNGCILCLAGGGRRAGKDIRVSINVMGWGDSQLIYELVNQSYEYLESNSSSYSSTRGKATEATS